MSVLAVFSEDKTIHHLQHYLPSQFPLKDFVHHNTLHAFQHEKFHKGLLKASQLFGYKTYLRLDEYRKLYTDGKINKAVLNRIITEEKGDSNIEEWLYLLLNEPYDTAIQHRIGKLRNEWKNIHKFNLSKYTHPILFRIIGNYIDQGIAIESFPIINKSFLESIRELEKISSIGIFKSERAKVLLYNPNCTLSDLLKIVVGDELLYERYLFDQQFEHPGWSGMVSVLEQHPETLLDNRSISLKEFIQFELLLEIDALENKFGNDWQPLANSLLHIPEPLFGDVAENKLFEALAVWQEAFEWTYYDHTLNGLVYEGNKHNKEFEQKTFQGIFCIDDRECSLRRHLENTDKGCQTYSTAGFFNVEFYFQPEGGKFYTKQCPAPVTPKYIIKEVSGKDHKQTDVLFSKQTYGLFAGWLITQTVGFWSAIKLLTTIFKPQLSSIMTYSFEHMDKNASLTIENKNTEDKINGLQVGFTINEMADRVEEILKSIGLVNNFASLIYIVGHGASSVNNTYYAGYDCGACSGRPGSVNARVAAHIANHEQVRTLLKQRGIDIPATTQFVGALQDTTRDEIDFFDEQVLSTENKKNHLVHKEVFLKALAANAKERARRFASIDQTQDTSRVHEKIKLRSVSLFEPRPEYNHATNTLCIIGRREVSKNLFLDRRSFLNSFDYRVDPEGNYLVNILKAAAPVCGGINLEYYFSRVDNQRLGAGSKLPHNVIGLIGVANGADGDLRTGLPQQMVEIHDPLRLLVIVEHFPDIVLKAVKKEAATYEWFINEWIHLVAIHPENKSLYRFENGTFNPYTPVKQELKLLDSIEKIIESEIENIEPIVLN